MRTDPSTTNLLDRIATLEEENRQLRQAIAANPTTVTGLQALFALTHSEAIILESLLTTPLVTRETLMLRLYGVSGDGNPATIDTFIRTLRGKIEPHQIQIRVVRGAGFWLPQVEQHQIAQNLRDFYRNRSVKVPLSAGISR